MAIEGAEKERNRLLLVHNTRPFSKTHLLMLAIEGGEKERNGLLLVRHTHTYKKQDHSVKLTS